MNLLMQSIKNGNLVQKLHHEKDIKKKSTILVWWLKMASLQ